MNQPSIPLDERGLPVGQPFDATREVSPREVKAMLDAQQPLLLIDCRGPDEWAITRIEGAELIPLPQVEQLYASRLAGREAEQTVVYCRSGARSLKFAAALRARGFRDVKSMAGGVLLWNRDVEPGGPQY